MAVIGPSIVVDAPETELPLHGLVQSATRVEGDDEKWEGGFQFQPLGCAQAAVWDPCSTGSDRAKSLPVQGLPLVEANPVVLEVGFQCTAHGLLQDEFSQRALHLLEIAKGKALEREFWTGTRNPSNQALVDTPADDEHVLNPGGVAAPMPVSPEMGLVLLSQALADCGSGARGFIHVTAGVGESLAQSGHSAEDDQGRLVTKSRGDVIVVGSGYDGSGPTGLLGTVALAPGQAWIYATGPVAYRMGEDEAIPSEFRDAFDRQTNTVTFRGEVTAAVVHDGCCTFAVLVDVGLGDGDGGDGPGSALAPFARDCPTPPVSAYSFTVAGRFNAAEADFPQELYPALFVLVDQDSIDPVPPLPFTSQLSGHIVDGPAPVGAPTEADVPVVWQVLQEEAVTQVVGVVLPLAIVGGFFPESVPLWLRMELFDGNHAATTVYGYFPDGIPTPEQDVEDRQVYLILDGVTHSLLIPGAPEHLAEGDAVSFDVENYVPTAAPVGRALAITNGCGPLEVSGVDGEPVPVDFGVIPVTVDGVQALPVAVQGTGYTNLIFTSGNACGDGTESTIGAGAVMIYLSHTAASPRDDGDYATIGNPGSTMQVTDLNPITLTAPPGTVFPAMTLYNVQASAGGGQCVSWIAYYPDL